MRSSPKILCSCSHLYGLNGRVERVVTVDEMIYEIVIVNLWSFKVVHPTDRTHMSFRLIVKIWVSHWLKESRDTTCFFFFPHWHVKLPVKLFSTVCSQSLNSACIVKVAVLLLATCKWSENNESATKYTYINSSISQLFFLLVFQLLEITIKEMITYHNFSEIFIVYCSQHIAD